MRTLARLLRNARGATAVEYGLILGAIAIAIILSLNNVAGGLGAVFGRIGNVFAP